MRFEPRVIHNSPSEEADGKASYVPSGSDEALVPRHELLREDDFPSPELAALAEQLCDDADRLAAIYPAGRPELAASPAAASPRHFKQRYLAAAAGIVLCSLAGTSFLLNEVAPTDPVARVDQHAAEPAPRQTSGQFRSQVKQTNEPVTELRVVGKPESTVEATPESPSRARPNFDFAVPIHELPGHEQEAILDLLEREGRTEERFSI